MTPSERAQAFLTPFACDEAGYADVLRAVPADEWPLFRSYVSAGLSDQRSRRGVKAVSLGPGDLLDTPQAVTDELIAWHRDLRLKEQLVHAEAGRRRRRAP